MFRSTLQNGMWAFGLTIVAVCAAYYLHFCAYWEGYKVKPDGAILCSYCKCLVLIVPPVLMFLPWKFNKLGMHFALRFALALCCMAPFLFKSFRADQGFEGFIARMKKDVNGAALVTELTELRNLETGIFVERPLTEVEWVSFGNRKHDYKLPRFHASNNEAEIVWGTDFQMWSIGLIAKHDCAFTWENRLCFRVIQK